MQEIKHSEFIKRMNVLILVTSNIVNRNVETVALIHLFYIQLTDNCNIQYVYVTIWCNV